MPAPGSAHECSTGFGHARVSPKQLHIEPQIKPIRGRAIHGRPNRAACLAGDRVNVDKLELVDAQLPPPCRRSASASAKPPNSSTMTGNVIHAAQVCLNHL